MIDPDDTAVLAAVGDALERLVDLDIDHADACGALALSALIELADVGDVQATLVIYREVLEHLMVEMGRVQAELQVRH